MSLRNFGLSIVLAALSTAAGPGFALAAEPGPALTIDASADRHPISPDIYGLNDNPYDAAFAKEIGLPVSRWGGDATTRYNWQVDASNAGDDWFFMAGGSHAVAVPGEGANKFVERIKAAGGKALLTIPVIDYINSSVGWDCSFPVSIFGPQQKVNPYVHPVVNGQKTDAGNGRTPDGKPIRLTAEQIRRVHIPNTPEHQKGWIEHLTARFGTAARGGVAVYEMDNEPGGWDNTHRDIHPDKPNYPEIVDKTIPYATMVKAADSTALVDGPGDFGAAVYKGDGKATGGQGNAEYYLSRMRAASEKAGVRLLDYFDEHYYPFRQDGEDDPARKEAIRLESTRSLWDPTYREKNWIGKYYGPIALLPTMHEWVRKNYPGTKIAVTEYNWGGMDTLNGALAEADVLGIFGREGLDLATLWGKLNPTSPAAYAFRLYRNYDGKGGRYGDTWVRSQSADQGRLSIYSALRTKDAALTLVVINKTKSDLDSRLRLPGYLPKAGGTLQAYRYSAANLKAILPFTPPKIGVEDNVPSLSVIYPAESMTLLILP